MKVWMDGISLIKQHCKIKGLGKSVCKDFETKNIGEYHDLHLKNHALRLADVFRNFRKICLQI